MAKAAPLVIDRQDRATLQGWARARKLPAGQVQRVKAILLIGRGASHADVARQMGTSPQTVVGWRARFEADGPEGFKDRAKSGRPPRIDGLAVVAETLADNGVPPRQLGVTHWSARLMARRMAELGAPVSFAEVARIWRAWGIQPHRVETFKFSTDPQLEAMLRDVVGLYLSPPANAVVVSVDEKSQIQALDRTQPMLPVRSGLPERQTHDDKRHTHVEFLTFLKKLARAHPRVELHVICDNYSTHKHDKVQAWLARHPRIRMHVPDRLFLAQRGRDPLWSCSAAKPSVAVPSLASPTSNAPSTTTSTATTTAPSPSPGPKPPTKSSPRSNRKTTSDTQH